MPLKMFLIVTVFSLTGCAGVEVNSYRAERPELKLEEYFNGTLDAWGMFQERDGKVVNRLKVVTDARWEGTAVCWTSSLPIATGPGEGDHQDRRRQLHRKSGRCGGHCSVSRVGQQSALGLYAEADG